MGLKDFLSFTITFDDELKKANSEADRLHTQQMAELNYILSPEGRRNKADQMISEINQKLERELSELRLEEQRLAAAFSERIADAQRMARKNEMEGIKSLF